METYCVITSRRSIARRALITLAIALLASPFAALAHEIPSDVRVWAFVKPEGKTLQLLMRVPLTAMREVDIPKRGPGFLDLARADAALRTAANLWLADNIDIYEGATRLAYPRVIDARVSLPSDKSFASFVEAGFLHIPEGSDHLLFLLCLVIPFRRFGALVMIVTSFTVAHSITLIASAYSLGPDALWFAPLIELLIALSIVYMAIENVIGTNVQRRWIITFAFGLVHGFAFSFALREQLQFAGNHLLTSLLSFNAGVELGQLLVLAVLIPVVGFVFKRVVPERIGIIILSVLIGHIGWHWLLERYERLSQFPWPALDAALLASAMRWVMAFIVMIAVMWAVNAALHKRATQKDKVSG